MSAHTLGRWTPAKLSPTDVLVGDVYIASARYGLNGLTHAQAVANAQLMAAAPELVDALRALRDAVTLYTDAARLADWPELDAANALLARIANGGAL